MRTHETRCPSSARRLPILLGLLGLLALSAPGCRARFQPGIEILKSTEFRSLRGRKIGLVVNHTAVDARLTHLADLIQASGQGELLALFGPEHGVRGEAQAGDRVEDARDPRTGIPVFSLYGRHRKPTPEMLEGIDLLIYDIQDIGVRTYTYLSTLLGVLEVAAGAGVEVWVLDRSNPLGLSFLEGPVLEPEMESFVGPHPVPLRHGLTTGEFARLVVSERGLEVKLRIFPEPGTTRASDPGFAPGTWISPSPNIPTPETALVYAGMVLVEGTNLSEGRGTTRPFHRVGAPWLDVESVIARLERENLPGVRFRPVGFVPTFSKHEGQACQGLELHVIDPAAFRPVLTAVALIRTVLEVHPGELEFREAAFDRLAGTSALREAILSGKDLEEIRGAWSEGLRRFRDRVHRHWIYPR